MDKDIRIEGLVNCLDWHEWRGIIFGIWIYGSINFLGRR